MDILSFLVPLAVGCLALRVMCLEDREAASLRRARLLMSRNERHSHSSSSVGSGSPTEPTAR